MLYSLLVASLLGFSISASASESALTSSVSSPVCGTPREVSMALATLPEDLRRLREGIERHERTQGAELDRMSSAKSTAGKWSDAQEGAFFRALVASDGYQGFERERTDIMNAYMIATESLISHLLASREIEACRFAELLRASMRSLERVSADQWAFMILSKDRALIDDQ